MKKINKKEENKSTLMYRVGGKINTNKQLIPKGVFGIDDGIGLGMSAVSGVVSLIQANKAKKEEQRMQTEVMKNNYDTALVEQNVYNEQFRKDNINDLPVYDKGGKIKQNPKQKPSEEVVNNIQRGVDVLEATAKYSKRSPLNVVPGSFGSALGLLDSAQNNRDINPADVIGLIPNGVTQAISEIIDYGAREKKRMKEVNSKMPRKAIQLKETNPIVKDNFEDGGNIPQTNTSSTKGKFDTVGGDLVPISEDAEVVAGNKHTEKKIDNSYGVTLSKNGSPVANVEDEEVVVNNDQVFSNKLKKGDETFADIALKVNSRIGELQEVLKTSKKPSEKFSIQRTIEGLENKNNNLFKEQELVKQNTVGSTQETVEVENGVVPKGEKGLKLKNAKSDAEFNKDAIVTKNIISTLPSLADNITNAIITAKAPKPSRPIVRRSPIIDTTVNVNPALAEIKSAITAGNTTVSNNTNNSAIARANITANNLRGLQASSGVLANKDAQEIQLRNNQNKVLADTANTNSELTEDYQWDLYQNRLERNSAISKNVKNLTEDVISMQGNINTDLKDQALLNMDAKRDPTGQTARDLSKEMKSKRAAYDARIKAINARRQAKIDKLNWYNKD